VKFWRAAFARRFGRVMVDDGRPRPEAIRFTGREIDDAKRLRTNVYNGCPHDPRCASYGACIQAIAGYLRTGERKSG